MKYSNKTASFLDCIFLLDNFQCLAGECGIFPMGNLPVLIKETSETNTSAGDTVAIKADTDR